MNRLTCTCGNELFVQGKPLSAIAAWIEEAINQAVDDPTVLCVKCLARWQWVRENPMNPWEGRWERGRACSPTSSLSFSPSPTPTSSPAPTSSPTPTEEPDE